MLPAPPPHPGHVEWGTPTLTASLEKATWSEVEMGSQHTQAQTQALGSGVASQTDQGSWAHAWPRGRVMDPVTSGQPLSSGSTDPKRMMGGQGGLLHLGMGRRAAGRCWPLTRARLPLGAAPPPPVGCAQRLGWPNTRAGRWGTALVGTHSGQGGGGEVPRESDNAQSRGQEPVTVQPQARAQSSPEVSAAPHPWHRR